jgi:hypothetical protein
MKLQPNGVCVKRTARKSRPFDRALPFFYPLLCRSTLVVKGNDALPRYNEVRDDEADPREQLARMPFHFGNDSPGMRPTLRLVAETEVTPRFLDRLCSYFEGLLLAPGGRRAVAEA